MIFELAICDTLHVHHELLAGLHYRIQNTIVRNTFSEFSAFPFKINGAGKVMALKEIEKMLKKEAIITAKNEEKQFISSMFIVPKKSDGFGPVINLK